MTKTDMILAYAYNNATKLDNEFDQMLANIKSRNVDEIDMLELIIAKAKAEEANENLTKIMRIMGL